MTTSRSELAPIAEHLRELPMRDFPPCIYFLLRGDEVIYIGQSTSVECRVNQHRKDPSKDFDRVVYFPCPAQQLDDMERLFLRAFKLPGNRWVSRRHVVPKAVAFQAAREAQSAF